MTRETLGYVRLEWTCPNCNSRNPGPQTTCTNCGSPQPKNVTFQQAETQELIQDQTEQAKAKAGADIHCAFCGARNPEGTETCSQCGANLKDGTRRESGQVVGAFQVSLAKQVACPSCGAQNADTNLNCAQCGAPLKASAPAVSPASQPAANRVLSLPMILLIIVLALVCVGGLVGFMVMASKTEGHSGAVQEAHWSRHVAVEGLVPVRREAWQADLPPQATLGACESKEHHVQSEPAEGAEKVCGTPYTVDKGSGYGEVIQDCEYHVYQDYCTYSILDWQVVDELELQGGDFSPRWPEPELASDQRVGARNEVYTIIFTTDQGEYSYSTSDSNLYQECTIGSQWTLSINAFNKIVQIEPAN